MKHFLQIGFLSFGLCAFTLLTAFQLLAFNAAWYDREFEAEGINQEFGTVRVQAYREQVLRFVQGQGVLAADDFNTKEITHLLDVRQIFWGIKILWLTLGIVIVARVVFYQYTKKKSLPDWTGVWLSSVGIHIFIIIISLAGFDAVFVNLHRLLFRNDLWLMDPQTDFIIHIFTPTLFFHLGITILAASLGISIFGSLISASGWIKNFYRTRKNVILK